MILVTGANGHLGSSTIEFLLKKSPASSIRGLVRDEVKGAALKGKGVNIAIGDYYNHDSLVAAMQGVDTLLLISSSSLTSRYEQHARVIKAAKDSGVGHIVYTSIVRSSLTTKFTAGIAHAQTEADIKASGMAYTIMGNTYYTEYLPMVLGNFKETGTIYYSAGDARINFASRTDMAEANAVVLSNPSAHQNKLYDITSSKAYTFHDIAVMVSGIVGKPIQYTDIPLAALKKGMLDHGLTEDIAEMMTSIANAMKSGEFNYTSGNLESLIGHKPLELEDFLKHSYSAKA